MVILQDLAEKWLSCKICQENGYLARFLQVRSGRAVLLLVVIHATHFILTRNLLKNQLRVFLRKIIILNGFKIWKYELSEENKLKSAFENCLHKTNYYQKLFSFNFIKIYKNYV